MIVFACPNPDCRSRYSVADNKAGKVAVCANPRCRSRIQIPQPPPKPAPALGLLLDPATGATIKDWRDEPPPSTLTVPEDGSTPDEASVPELDRGELTELRCYDCGSRICEHELVRRDVSVGSSSWFGWGSGTRSSWNYSGYSTRYGRVDLCQACSKARDAAAWLRLVVMLIIGGLFLLFLFCAGIIGALQHATQ